MSPTRPSAPPRRGGAATRRSNARAAVCSPGSSPTRARCPPRAPQRAHPPLPAQENQLRRPDGRGPAGHRPGDQRHPHEGPGLGNTQRGLIPRTRQANVEDKLPKDERCTYKLNSGSSLMFNVIFRITLNISHAPHFSRNTVLSAKTPPYTPQLSNDAS